MNPGPTAYLIVDPSHPDAPGALWHAGTIEGEVAGTIHPLFKRNDIAPLRVPLVDQNDTFVGWEHRKADDLLREEAYRDDDGTVWTRPTAEAYARACAALHKHRERVERLEAVLARAVDGVASLEEAQQLLKEDKS